eukprot:COSAG06_NODE_3719_length_4977_cov_3.316523_7_plen_201_part_00
MKIKTFFLAQGTSLYYQFYEEAIGSEDAFQQKIEAVCREIGDRGRPKQQIQQNATTNVSEGVPPAPAPARALAAQVPRAAAPAPAPVAASADTSGEQSFAPTLHESAAPVVSRASQLVHQSAPQTQPVAAAAAAAAAAGGGGGGGGFEATKFEATKFGGFEAMATFMENQQDKLIAIMKEERCEQYYSRGLVLQRQRVLR